MGADEMGYRGVVAHQHGRFHEAIAFYERALSGNPSHAASILTNLLDALVAANRAEDAVARFGNADADYPRNGALLFNLANAYREAFRPADAIQLYRRAAGLLPGDVRPLHNLSFALLEAGDWEEGWATYEVRWALPPLSAVAHPPFPRWGGDPRCDVLVWAEQGLGDTIQFSRYVPLVAGRGSRVVFEVPATMHALMKGSMPNGVRVLLAGDPRPRVDAQCPLVSLPSLFGTTPDSVPWSGPYLSGPREIPTPRNVRPLVGIAWVGSHAYRNDLRPVPGELLAAAVRAGGGEPHAIQPGPAPAGVTECRSASFAETAAAMANMDVIVSIDTATAHLAGALGLRAVVLLAKRPEWRWGATVERTPCYPTVTLLRQLRPGDWSDPLRNLTALISAIRP